MSENPLNILTEIVAPDLTQETFASGLREAFENINDNFKKIIASPIYRGQRGESVKIKPVDILVENTGELVFTEVGQNIVKTIFEVDLSDWNGTYSSLTSKIESMYGPVTAGGATAADYFKINNTILFFYMDTVEETLVCPAQVYMFQDCRTPELSTAVVKNYVDVTSCISFTWEDDTYEFIKSNEFPTISWSESIGDYVWNINGTDTNITTKGLNGVDGTTVVPIFKSNSNEGDYEIDSMYVADSSGWMTIAEVYSGRREIWDTLLIGQTCVVYQCDDAWNVLSTETTSISSKISNDEVVEVHAHRLDMNLATAEPLHVQLAKIRKVDENNDITDTTPSGIFIPASVNIEHTTGEHIVHMIYRDNTPVSDNKIPDVHFALVRVDSSYKNPDTTDLQANVHFDNYQKYIFNNGISITNDTISNDTINVIGRTYITGSTNITGTTTITTSNNISNSSTITVDTGGIKITGKNNFGSSVRSTDVRVIGRTGIIMNEPSSNNIKSTAYVLKDEIILTSSTVNINTITTTSNTINIGNKTGSTTYIRGAVAIGEKDTQNTTITGKTIAIGDSRATMTITDSNFTNYLLSGRRISDTALQFDGDSDKLRCEITFHGRLAIVKIKGSFYSSKNQDYNYINDWRRLCEVPELRDYVTDEATFQLFGTSGSIDGFNNMYIDVMIYGDTICVRNLHIKHNNDKDQNISFEGQGALLLKNK